MQVKILNQKPQIKSKNPSFKAEIYYLNESPFYNKLASLRGIFEVGNRNNKEWLIEEAALIKPKAFTRIARNCVAFSIINPETKNLNMYHLSPEYQTMSRIELIPYIIFNQAKELKKNSSLKLEGLVTAGDYGRQARKDEAILLNTIIKTFKIISKKLGMDYSVIAGRKNGDTEINIISDAVENSHYINIYPYNMTNHLDIINLYKKRILSLNDNFYISEENITDKLLKNISQKPQRALIKLVNSGNEIFTHSKPFI